MSYNPKKVLFQMGGVQWTNDNINEGILITGSIGSGKTTGSGDMIARSLLMSGRGGVVFVVKHDETERWIDLCNECGRSNDLMIMSPDGEHGQYSFDFMQYELTRTGSDTESVVKLLKLFSEAANGGVIETKEAFFKLNSDRLARNCINLLKMATGTVTLRSINRLINNAPVEKGVERDTEWRETNYFARQLKLAMANAKGDAEKEQIVEDCEEYFFGLYRSMGERTRASITGTLTCAIDPFLHGHLEKTFCSSKGINFHPRLSRQGKVLILNLPLKKYHDVGSIAQRIYKEIWQREMEATKLTDDTLGVYMYGDEFQHIVTPTDLDFQDTARGQRIATILLTQNLRSLYRVLGENDTKLLANNLVTKIFHANSCDATAKFFCEDLVGYHYVTKKTQNSGTSAKAGSTVFDDPSHSFNESESEERRLIIEPHELYQLKTGGDDNNFEIESYVHRARKSSKRAIKAAFKQQITKRKLLTHV